MAGLQGQVSKGKCLRPNPFCCTCVWVKILQALPMSRGYQSWTAVANGATLSQMFLSFWGPHLQLLQPCCMQNTSTLIKKSGTNALKNPLTPATQICEYLSVQTGRPDSWKLLRKYHPMWLSILIVEGRRADFTFSFSLLPWEHCACLLQCAWAFVIMVIIWKLKIEKYCSPLTVH